MQSYKFLFPIFLIFSMMGVGCVRVPEPDSVSQSLSSPSSGASMETTQKTGKFPGILPAEQIEKKQARIATEKGDIVIRLFSDTAPKTVSNFIYLAEGGFYNGLTFHRREEGFVIQGGDPNGNGTGGPGYRFEDELNDNRTYRRGIVAMANAGPDTNGSQFFIMLANVPLPKSYSIFGEVISGMAAVDAVRVGDRMTAVRIESAP